MARVWEDFSVMQPTPEVAMLLDQGITGRWVDKPDVPVTAASGSYGRNPWFNQNNPRVTPLRSEPVVIGQTTGSRVNKASSNRNTRKKVVLPPDSVDYSHSTTPPLPRTAGSAGIFVRDENGNPIPIYDGSRNTGQFLTSHNVAKESIRSGYTDSNGYLLDENGNILYDSNKNPVKGTFSNNSNNISAQPVIQLSQEPNNSTPVTTQIVTANPQVFKSEPYTYNYDAAVKNFEENDNMNPIAARLIAALGYPMLWWKNSPTTVETPQTQTEQQKALQDPRVQRWLGWR